MPPKKCVNLARLKNTSTESKTVERNQCTISKFFAKSNTFLKKADENETILIDGLEEESSHTSVKECKVSSPFKKRQRDVETPQDSIENVKRRRSAAEKLSVTSSFFKHNNTQSLTETHTPSFFQHDKSQLMKDPEDEKLKEIAAKTREKLQNFVAAEVETISSDEIKAFNFDVLKRARASVLPDINVNRLENAKGNVAEELENKEMHEIEIIEPEEEASSSTETVLSVFKNKRRYTAMLSTSLKEKPSAAATKKSKMKYTQLEQQFMEIKEKYPDAVLFVECGYKYRFFGEDAEIAAKVLKIFCHLDHNFMTASIPVHRLLVHVRRIVAAGYKVGVVKQTETAALKAAGSNKSAPFTRQLSALYTKATLIGEDVDSVADGDTPQDNNSSVMNSYLMCICDSIKDKSTNNQLIGVVAVQPSTGDIIHDCFEDSSSRSELETRLAHIQPVEILMSHDVTEATEKLVTGLQAVSINADDRLRIEKLGTDQFDSTKCLQTVSQFYQSMNTSKDASKLQQIINLPRPVVCCLAALINYLRDFNLEKVLYQLDNFTQFSTKSRYMQLSGNTVRNLELFNNATDGQEKGSLFWTLNQTVTKSGARMFRSWLAKPLMCVRDIKARQDAVYDINSDRLPDVQSLKGILARLPDLEKGLCSIYHKKCSPQEFFTVCKALETVYDKFNIVRDAVKCSKASDWLKELMSEIPELLSDIEDYSKALNEKEARENDKTKMFTDESQFPAISECKNKISSVLQDINSHRREVRLAVRQPALEYTTVQGTEFLVEVKNCNMAFVPKDWTKISSTKVVSRFHTPYIVKKYKELNQWREQLLIVCNEAWIQFLDSFSEKYQCYRKAVHLLSTLDCLFSLAVVAQNNGYCRPEFCEDTVCIDIKQGCHPVIKTLLAENDQYVPNDTCLSSDGKRVMIITGPNMGGKSSYIKQVATLIIMAQIGSYIPAESAKLGVFDAVFTRMGASDEIYKGRSTFMVELLEASEIIAKATSRSLVILDELGRGTSTHDGVAIAHATLNFFINQPRSLTLFVTHYPELAEFEDTYPQMVGNFHMSFLVSDDSSDEKETVTFLYQLVAGTAARSYGLNVASLASIPGSILSLATEKSHSLEEKVSKRRKQMALFGKLCSSPGDNINTLKQMINEIE